MYNFPDSPTLNQVFGNYTWDGTKWTTTAGTAPAPATATPLMDQTAGVVGVATKYAREDHIHPIWATGFDALAYNGLQINGSADVSQEHGATAIVVGGFVADGWTVGLAGTMIISSAQVPLGAGAIPGLQYCISHSVTTPQAVMGAGDLFFINQNIEGYRVARLGWGTAGAQPITVAFWSAHSHTGLYSFRVCPPTGTRSYVASYTQAAANIWQYNVITIPGDTTGTWPKDNSAGLTLGFAGACGSTYTAPAVNTWYGANYVAAPGQVNGISAVNDALRITGVIVLPGIEAPSAARSPFIMRPYDQELVTCQRYWELASGSYRGLMPTSGFLGTHGAFTVTKRANPTCTFVSNGSTVLNSSGASFFGQNIYGTGIQFSGTASSDSYNYGFLFAADARL